MEISVLASVSSPKNMKYDEGERRSQNIGKCVCKRARSPNSHEMLSKFDSSSKNHERYEYYTTPNLWPAQTHQPSQKKKCCQSAKCQNFENEGMFDHRPDYKA